MQESSENDAITIEKMEEGLENISPKKEEESRETNLPELNVDDFLVLD